MIRFAAVAAVLLTLAAGASAPPAQARQLACDFGPVQREYGGQYWKVFACEDDRTIILVAGPGNRATPYVFTFAPGEGEAYVLTGKGAGDPTYVEKARSELATLRPAQVRDLHRAAKAKGDGA
ncbi:MAG: hypothetical protein K1X35_05265 [Caulobacteraceae bacterium]|nr:hypothetical protein [Caulobacteraceae bacterium]